MGREARVKQSLANLRRKRLVVGTPLYGGQCHGLFAASCLNLVKHGAALGIDVNVVFLFDQSLITIARNDIVDMFLAGNGTHLLFIDGDEAFDSEDVFSMLALDEPIVGGPCPIKVIAWDMVRAAARAGVPAQDLTRYTGVYAMNLLNTATNIESREPVPVLDLGTGFMMIRRDVFDVIRGAHPDRWYVPSRREILNPAVFNMTVPEAERRYAYFDTMIDPESHRYLSEDFAFCKLARDAGLEILVCPWVKVQHIGPHVFAGSLADTAMAQSAARAPLASTG